MSERVSFLVPHPPKALRPNRRAAHWATRAKAADEYSERVWHRSLEQRVRQRFTADPLTMPWPRASVTYTWRYAGVAPDIDNIAGALKVLQDCLCLAPANGKPGRNRWYLGLIENDSGIEATFRRMKVATRKEEGVMVEVERIET